MDLVEMLSRHLNLFEIIFQHFTVLELITVSEVNTFWYDSIASSRKFMKKIKIVLGKEKLTENKFIKLLKNSSRKYQNFELTACHFMTRDFSDEIENFLSLPQHEWKNITLKGACFSSMWDVHKVLKAVKNDVEYLEISDITLISSNGGKQNLKFPVLKSLKLKNLDRKIFEECFLLCENLQHLYLLEGYFSLGSKGTQTLLSLLKNNKTLHRLYISSHIFNQIFYKDITENLSLKLKSFALENVFEALFDETARLNFFYFLLSQMNHLERVKLTWMGAEVLKLLFLMPKLTHVELTKIHSEKTNIPWKCLNLRRSLSIIHLDYEDVSCSEMVFEALLNATPSLKTLRVHTLNQKMMDYLAAGGRKLDKLSVECLLGRKKFDEKVAKLVDNIQVDLSVK
jgi:hypothetical protein